MGRQRWGIVASSVMLSRPTALTGRQNCPDAAATQPPRASPENRAEMFPDLAGVDGTLGTYGDGGTGAALSGRRHHPESD
jgi:hypothetical protein